MLILSYANGGHDSSAVVADNYEVLAAVHTERISRKKGDSQFAHAPTINAALDAAGAKIEDLGALVVSHGRAPIQNFNWGPLQGCYLEMMRFRGKDRTRPTNKRGPSVDRERFKSHFRVPKGTEFQFYNHHYAHALSALFFTDWPEGLIYTADGGGDSTNYSCYHFHGNEMLELDGDYQRAKVPFPADSIGIAYGMMTKALGYKINRHEGKLTGLAAYGEPVLYEKLARFFWVDDSGRVRTSFDHPINDIRDLMLDIGKSTTPENAAASVQKLLEEVVLKSIGIYLERTGARRVGLAGGVFANVALNRRISELRGVDEVFVFPAMADDGIAVGGIYQYLLERDGIGVWSGKRRRLNDVYWGGAFDGNNDSDDEVARVFTGKAKLIEGDVADVTARLLSENRIVALYCGRMEFGPRALGARSILANATDKSINDTLNKRLSRTEFMPFAPVVLSEDADSVFEVNSCNRYAMRFMTITCLVRRDWRERIPAVVHVDGTARPQIAYDEDNPLYAQILRRYKEKTGLPVLINTSFNAHEEPIICTPEQCFKALQSGRVDYVATKCGVWKAKEG